MTDFIKLDITESDLSLSDYLEGLPGQVEAGLNIVAHKVKDRIIELASQELHSSFVEYRDSVKVIEEGSGTSLYRRIINFFTGRRVYSGSKSVASVVLDGGWLPNAIESGWEGGDMRPYLLKSKPYRSINFQHQTPGRGRTGSLAMGAYEAKWGSEGSRRIGGSIYRKALKLPIHGKSGNPITSKKSRLTRSQVHSSKALIGSRREGYGGNAPDYEHKDPIYFAMRREIPTSKKARGSQYSTYRTISWEGGDPASWIHPGIRGRDFFGRVSSEIRFMVDDAMSELLGGA